MAPVRRKLTAANLQALNGYYEAEDEGQGERAVLKPRTQSNKVDPAQREQDIQWIMQKIMSAQLIDFQYSLAPSDSPTIAVLESIKPEGDQEELHKREQRLKDVVFFDCLKYQYEAKSDDEAVEYPTREEFESAFNLVEWWLERCDQDEQDDSGTPVTIVGGEQMQRPMLDVLPWQGFCADRSVRMESNTSSSSSETSTSSSEAFTSKSRRSPINLGSLLNAENGGQTSIQEQPSEFRLSSDAFMLSLQRSAQGAQKSQGQYPTREGTSTHQPSIAAPVIQTNFLRPTKTTSSSGSEEDGAQRTAESNNVAQSAKPVGIVNEVEEQRYSVPSTTRERRARRAANRMDKHRREERERYWASRD